MRSSQLRYVYVLIVCAALGAVFAAVSSYDFVAHLDRQVHAITCSFIPGVGAADRNGTSGCYAALMSPYSSVLRTSMWGGIPIALPALSVFAYLLFLGFEIIARRGEADRRATLFLLAATLLPLLVSVVYFIISVAKLGTVCKLCVGIYLASIGSFIGALMAHRKTAQSETAERPWRGWALRFAGGVAFVLVPLLLYVAMKPAVAEAGTGCGALLHPEDKYGVRLKLHPSPGGVPAVELLDPLCPACAAFSRRLEASGLRERLDLEAVLFPLDKECNWMVSESLHPGACAVSEAVLCAGAEAPEVLEWAGLESAALRALGVQGPRAIYARVRARFPHLASCVGRHAVKARLNKSLRWVVSNSLPVLTPQLFLRGRKICDEDTDLGLEYALERMLERTGTEVRP